MALLDIALVRSSTTINLDRRTPNIYRSLSKRYSTLVLGWNRQGISREVISQTANEPLLHLKLFNLKAPVGTPSLIAYLPLFWLWILIELFVHKPNVVHACDLDTVLPCYIYKIVFRKKMVFDVFDRYAMAFIPPKFRTLYSFVNSLEDLFASKSDVLLNVSDELQRTFVRKPKHCVTIMNCPHELDVPVDKSETDVLTLAFMGHVRKGRGLEQMATAVKDLEGVELVVAGQVTDRKLLDDILKIPNVQYRGWLPFSEALEVEASSDVMIALYDSGDPINKFSMGSKIFESMMCGIPLITNVTHDLIKEIGCGMIVEYNDIDQIKATIINLRDNKDLRTLLGKNGRKAFLEKYNWTAMEDKLYKIYENLLPK
ncbi:MAG: hypothetical protein DLM72_20030 [Candidatus Nitrosopolaris wilkensis]|nr:MAG: hypothetical protein DLM72_20030 [Candidatus Nitrosopolaris wilkensis]